MHMIEGLHTLQPRRRPDLPGVACLIPSADRCSVPSVRACVSVRGLLWAWSVLLPVLCSPSGCAGGWGLHRRGIQRAPGVGQVMPAHSEANKKGVFRVYPPPLSCVKHPTPIVNSKNFAQKQKDPYKGSVFCAILALQALKGRNLQWLKVK